MLIEAFLAYYSLFLLGSAPLAIPAFLLFHFTVHSKNWKPKDFLLFILPVLLYTTCDAFRAHRLVGHGKSLSNLVEPLVLGIACGLIFIIRCFLAKLMPDKSAAISSYALIVASVLALAIYFLTPALPE